MSHPPLRHIAASSPRDFAPSFARARMGVHHRSQRGHATLPRREIGAAIDARSVLHCEQEALAVGVEVIDEGPSACDEPSPDLKRLLGVVRCPARLVAAAAAVVEGVEQLAKGDRRSNESGSAADIRS
jgi:hypothetical protein